LCRPAGRLAIVDFTRFLHRMHRTPILLGLVVALAVAAAAEARPKKKPAPAPPPPAAVVAAPAPAPAPAAPTLASLMSASDDDVKARLGVPDIAREEGASAMWTYAWPDCALMVFFKSSDGRNLHVSGATAGPRRRNQTAPTVDACLAHYHGHPPHRDDAGAIDALLAPPQ
jgi:hypothetical protein